MTFKCSHPQGIRSSRPKFKEPGNQTAIKEPDQWAADKIKEIDKELQSYKVGRAAVPAIPLNILE